MMRGLFSALTPLALALAAAIVSARAEATDAAAPASARGMPDMDLTHSLRARLAAWLLGPAPVRDGMPVLFPAFCNQLVRAGLPIWRRLSAWRPCTRRRAVVAKGGEILKFMDDGFLAVFLVDGEPDTVCDRALAAAVAAVAASRRLDREFAREGRAPLRFGLALHLGEVEFGNIGTHDRLDFTAMGPAVNHASRLEALTKELRSPVLASAAFAGRVSRPMRPLGRFVLRGIASEVEVYAP